MPKRSSSVGQIESLSGRVGRPSGFASEGASGRSRRVERSAIICRVCLQLQVTASDDDGAASYAAPGMTELAPLTTIRLGGPARRLVEARTEADAVAAVREADASGEPLLVLAGGSNVVIADEGFPGTVVHVQTRGVDRLERRGRVELEVQAGELWDDLVAATVADGLAGIECLSGIPGSTGATPIQNVGAYGQEVATTITGVRAFDRHTGQVHELAPDQCGFGYRTSALKRSDRRLVLSVRFTLQPGGASHPVRYAELARALDVELGERVPPAVAREAVLALRRAKGMVVDPEDP